jgi:NAD(P)-dependent dehydrogenase (short-subunit alcohol dehydrogenase family)
LSPVAVVTGGGAGIGGATARLLARDGASVLLNDVDEALARANAAAIESAGGTAVIQVGDIREPETVAALAERALDLGRGHVDVLVNNVGHYAPAGNFAETTESDWEQQYAINLLHVFRCTRALLPSMLERGSGAIVNVSTVEAIRGIPQLAVYSAFNAGVIGFTRSLAVEVGHRGVRVNAIAPDLTDTPQTPRSMLVPEGSEDMVPSWLPIARIGEPEDAAEVIAFLASERARFVTGTVIPVDGGTLAAGGWYKKRGRARWTNRPEQP